MSKRYGIVVDLKRCIGCNTCVLACKMENNVPLGPGWLRVVTNGGPHMDSPSGKYPHLKMEFMPVSCQHCDKPPCVPVCPTGATYKSEEGPVLIDWDKCTGCRGCIDACPYGAMVSSVSVPQRVPAFRVGSADAPLHQQDVVEKCTLCVHRVNNGQEPACVECCPTQAMHFGDLNDPKSQVAKLVSGRTSFRLLEEMGTEPSMYFLR